MATITNYATLQSTIADYLNRQDLNSQIQTFIQFVEADLNTRVRCREMIQRSTTTSDQEYVALPSDWLEAINLQITDGTSPLRFVTLDMADSIKKRQLYNQVTFYTLMDGAIELVPSPTDNVEIEMVYYKKIPSLSDAATTNWLLLKAPDVYLYGALVHAAPFLVDDQRINTFNSFYDSRVNALIGASNVSQHSGSPLIARPRKVLGV